MFKTKGEGQSKVLSSGFCFNDSEAEQRALKFFDICYLNVNYYSLAPDSNK